MLILQEHSYTVLQIISVIGGFFCVAGMSTSLSFFKTKKKPSTKTKEDTVQMLSTEQEFFSRFEEIPYPDSDFEKKPDVINLAKQMDDEKDKREI